MAVSTGSVTSSAKQAAAPPHAKATQADGGSGAVTAAADVDDVGAVAVVADAAIVCGRRAACADPQGCTPHHRADRRTDAGAWLKRAKVYVARLISQICALVPPTQLNFEFTIRLRALQHQHGDSMPTHDWRALTLARCNAVHWHNRASLTPPRPS